jgi:hypothetical protein
MMTYNMTFAAGWHQEIDPANEKQDLLTYINDTHKAVWGYRPRWDAEWVENVTLPELRKEAQNLELEVLANINREIRQAELERVEARRVAQIWKEATAPVSNTYKPFANIKEIL